MLRCSPFDCMVVERNHLNTPRKILIRAPDRTAGQRYKYLINYHLNEI